MITEILWIWILLSLNYKFLDSKGLQVTHMEALNPFNSKLMTLTARWGLWTFSVILALCVPLHWVHNNVSPGSPCLTVAPFLHSSQAHRTTSWNVNLAYSNIYSLVYFSKIPRQVLGLGVTRLGLNTGAKQWISNKFASRQIVSLIYRGSSAYAAFWDFGKTSV